MMENTLPFLDASFADDNVQNYARYRDVTERLPFQIKMKRALDLAAVSGFMIAAGPLMLMIAALIKLDSKGPVFFRQERHGQNGTVFKVLKFRTMYTHLCDAKGGQQASKGDPRVTRIGRFLRKTSLDEIPQFLNILKGEMSFVGPRPHAISHDHYYAQHITYYWKRHDIKPGLTGWAQIHGHRGETRELDQMRDRILYDLDYIRRQSVWLDLKVIFKTFWVVVRPPQNNH